MKRAIRDSEQTNIPFYISSSARLCRPFNHKILDVALPRLRFCSIRNDKSGPNLSAKPGISVYSKSLWTFPVLLLSLFILSPPQAAALPAETVCIQCHGAQSGRLGEPVGLWKGSVHEVNGISCHGCHGGDPTDMAMAMSPARGFLGVPGEKNIPDFCGRCHVGVKEDYLASAHGRALGSGGPHCVTCHGSHRVRTATPDLINRRDCTRCHDYGRAEEIKSAVAETDRRITALEQSLAKLHRIGVTTKEMDGELFALRNRFHRLFHSVEVDKVRSRTAGFQKELAGIGSRVARLEEELDRRKLWGGAVVVLLAGGGILALLIYRSYRRES